MVKKIEKCSFKSSMHNLLEFILGDKATTHFLSHFTVTVPYGRVVAAAALTAVGKEARRWQVVPHYAEHLVDLQCVR